MQVINILPIENQMDVSRADKWDRPYMFLTHLILRNKKYAEFAMAYPGYKILDNSLIENRGNAMDMSDVMYAADMIEANEVILPDVFRDGCKTIESTMKALELCADKPYKKMAVVHGRDLEDWLTTYYYFNNVDEISVLGIPKVCAKMHPMGRVAFEPYWQETNKEIHLLGLWYSFTELTYYKRPDQIRSVDSCQLAFLSKYGLPLNYTRPDGFTVDLEYDKIDSMSLENMEDQLCCMNL